MFLADFWFMRKTRSGGLSGFPEDIARERAAPGAFFAGRVSSWSGFTGRRSAVIKMELGYLEEAAATFRTSVKTMEKKAKSLSIKFSTLANGWNSKRKVFSTLFQESDGLGCELSVLGQFNCGEANPL